MKYELSKYQINVISKYFCNSLEIEDIKLFDTRNICSFPDLDNISVDLCVTLKNTKIDIVFFDIVPFSKYKNFCEEMYREINYGWLI
jgi:hypothetical protein